ncbi:hypothetical protein [Spirosoma oryzicola]|uniref:hypothetical protein n=1 Tax=Spirosoma oryzicola TaxID=2898794 RepID=UPI001E33133A|nr:hypothetical protein [Spirosoma oryzicola]UHG90106.1 hypothetical protein LQ777_17860 [Spirosoma oryzicola]
MSNLQDELSLTERLTAPTPKLFQKIRNGGIILATFAAAILSLEAKGVIVPSGIEMVASGIATVAGIIGALVAQFTVNLPEYEIKKALNS